MHICGRVSLVNSGGVAAIALALEIPYRACAAADTPDDISLIIVPLLEQLRLGRAVRPRTRQTSTLWFTHLQLHFTFISGVTHREEASDTGDFIFQIPEVFQSTSTIQTTEQQEPFEAQPRRYIRDRYNSVYNLDVR